MNRSISSTPLPKPLSMQIAKFDGREVTAREQYREAAQRSNRATDREIDDAARSAVEKISDRKQIRRPA